MATNRLFVPCLEVLEGRALLSRSHFTPPNLPTDLRDAYQVLASSPPGQRGKKYHDGYDMQLAQDGRLAVPIPTAEAGQVVFAGDEERPFRGYGKAVVVRYSDGTEQLFAHLSSITVAEGEHVSQGESVGIQGNTGHVIGPTGIHLHTEVGELKGKWMVDRKNQLPFLIEYLHLLKEGKFQAQRKSHAPMAKMVVTPGSLTFTVKQNAPDPAPQTLLVWNYGHIGSTLNLSATGSDILSVQLSKTEVHSGDFAVCTVTAFTSGLPAGTYDKAVTISDTSGNSKTIDVTVNVQAATALKYTGSFSGTVSNNDFADNGNDPDGSFTDSYGGPATLTLTKNPDNSNTLELTANLKTNRPHGEDFSANPDVVLILTAQTIIQFPMGDGMCVLQIGSVSLDTISGTWKFVATSSSDNSDSGSGTFSLQRVP